MNQKPYLVGITGGSASGKTLFIKQLLESFPREEICLLSQDHYYRDRHLQPKDTRGVSNFDMPESLDLDAFAKDVARLHAGETITLREYTYNNPNVVPKTLVFRPAPVMVVEGIFAFYRDDIRNQFDLKVFIDAEEHIKLSRRIRRDGQERGYDMDDVLYRYEHHVAPTYERYIRPFKSEADLIIPNNHSFDKALEVLIHFLKGKAEL